MTSVAAAKPIVAICRGEGAVNTHDNDFQDSAEWIVQSSNEHDSTNLAAITPLG